jgi:hypothetical protein
MLLKKVQLLLLFTFNHLTKKETKTMEKPTIKSRLQSALYNSIISLPDNYPPASLAKRLASAVMDEFLMDAEEVNQEGGLMVCNQPVEE